MTKYIYTKNKDSFMGSEYEEVKKILIKHDVLHKDIDQLDDPILMQDLFESLSRRNAIWHTKS